MAAKSFYAVLPDTTVYRCKTAADVSRIEGAFPATDSDVSKLPTSLIVKLYNRVRPERPVTKFAYRAVAEKQMSGVLDFLAKGWPVTAPAVTPKAGSLAAGKRGAKPKEISPDTVARVVRMKEKGLTWLAICAELGEQINFVHRIRPHLRAINPALVKALGPGSANYGKGPAPKVKRDKLARRTRKGNGAPVEVF